MLQRHIRVTALTAVRHFTAVTQAVETSSASIAAASSAESTTTTTTTTTSSSSSGKGRDTLGRRLFALVHPKRSAVVTINNWKEEGHLVRKYELNRIVRELRRLKRYKHALEICEWMRTQEDIELLPGDYAVHLDLIAKLRGLSSAEKFFEDLPEEMRRAPTLSALLHTYVKNHVYAKAETLMNRMLECGYVNCPLPYNHLISMYLENGKLEKIPPLIRALKENTKPDAVSYNLWLTMCQSQNDVKTAEEVFLEMKKAKVLPDWMTYSILASLYTKKELNDKAEFALKEMVKRVSRKNRASYSSLISLQTNLGKKDEVHQVWKKMKSLFRKLNDAEYICMISSLIKFGELEEAEKFYFEWKSISTTGDSRIPNLLIAAYINNGQMGEARKFFDFKMDGIRPSYTTWELFTWGYLKEKQMVQVLDCFAKAVNSVAKWVPDERLVCEIYKHLEEQEDIEGAEKMLKILREAGYVSTKVYNMLLRIYAKAGKMPLIVTERMEKDKVLMDKETEELLSLTSNMCVTDIASCLA